MIESMKKVTIVCLASEKQDAVRAMQKLGTLHVTPSHQPQSRELDQLKDSQARLNRALTALAEAKAEDAPSHPAEPLSPQDALDRTIAALDELDQLKTNAASLQKDLELLAPWGSFESERIRTLASEGIHVIPCVAPRAVIAHLALPEDAVAVPISGTAKKTYFAVVSRTLPEDSALPRAALPECTDLHALENRLALTGARSEALRRQLAELAASSLDSIRSLAPAVQNELDYATAVASMGDSSCFTYSEGYVPSKKLDMLLACARKSGWAIRYEDIREDDRNVPTLLSIPRRFAMAQAVFDFVGILPGYFETDVSIAMFLFLSLFCGMLIGDAGYGVLLLLLSLWLKKKVKSTAARNGVSVLLAMSACVFVFGALSGNWFGIPSSSMPVPFCGIPWLAQDSTQEHIKLLCFFIGAVHTSLAHIWTAYNRRKSIKDVIGNLGWAFFLWANFFAASKLIAGGIPHTDGFMFGLYGIGFIAILTCSINWKNFGDVIYSPFSFINSFVDILSYIRLFAVGLSGVYIAASFNDMAAAIWNANPWLIPVGLIILLVGHLMNIAMAALSILVHGVRLNTLEFSGHIGLSWSGRPYKPLHETEG